MVEHFTQKELDTALGEDVATTVQKTENKFEESLKQELDRLVKEPSLQTIANILNFSKSLQQ